LKGLAFFLLFVVLVSKVPLNVVVEKFREKWNVKARRKKKRALVFGTGIIRIVSND
jgi:hypothetical protein